jgi:hypothetical protein
MQPAGVETATHRHEQIDDHQIDKKQFRSP